jgi:hypothetical protein
MKSAAQVLLSCDAERAFKRVQEELSLTSVLAAGCRFGFRKDALVAMIDPAPPALKALLKRAVQAVQAMSAVRTQLLAVAGSGETLGVGGNGARTLQDGLHGVDVGCCSVMSAEAGLWEGEREWSFLSVQYDPVTSERQRIVSNERMAEVSGMSREELLARFAGREMHVPFVEADWLANFIHDLEFAEETRNERYLRVFVGPGQAPVGGLALSVKVKHFNAAGRVVRVRLRPPPPPSTHTPLFSL